MSDNNYTQVADIDRDDGEIIISTHEGSVLCETLEELGTSSFSIDGTEYGVVCESRRSCSLSKEFKLRQLRVVRTPKLQTGDVVNLRSGGPHMTISTVHDDDKIRCIWWNDEALTYANGLFSTASLELKK